METTLLPTTNQIKGEAKSEMKQKKMEFARKLREAMLNRGWNQSELARRANIGRDNISGYIKARNLPGITHLKKLADALGMGPNDLLEGGVGTELTEQDTLEIKATTEGKVRIRVSQEVTFEKAMEIMKILQKPS